MKKVSLFRLLVLVTLLMAGFSDYAVCQKVATLTQVVNKTSTTTALSSSLNAVNVGTGVQYTAKVTPAKASGPTGTVTFTATGTQTTNVFTSSALPLPATGSVTWDYTIPAVDTYTITAVYSGDKNFAGSQVSSSELIAGAKDFSLTLPASMSVTKGQSASIAVSLTPLNGFSGNVTLSCSGAPYGSVCAINNNSVSLSSNLVLSQASSPTNGSTSSVATNLTISTAAVSVTSAGLLLFVGGLGGIRRRKYQIGAAALVCVAILTLGVSGCAGGNHYTQNNGTPVGSYPITVTATSGALSHSSTTMLKVVAN